MEETEAFAKGHSCLHMRLTERRERTAIQVKAADSAPQCV